MRDSAVDTGVTPAAELDSRNDFLGAKLYREVRTTVFQVRGADAAWVVVFRKKGFVTLAGFTCFYCLRGESQAKRFQCLSIISPPSKKASTCSM